MGEVNDPIKTPNINFYQFFPKNLAAVQTYFRRFAVSVSDTFPQLTRLGLIRWNETTWKLTESGRIASREIRRERPPIWYWYKNFYIAIENSSTFSEYCTRVFGRDLSQHGFSNLAEINFMLNVLRLSHSIRVLDLGCGNGKIAEYISDLTGAEVTGVDYIPEAIAQAKRRTQNKQTRLHFIDGNLEQLNFNRQSFDVILSIDSIFFGQQMTETISHLMPLLSPGGSLAAFCDETLGRALDEMGLSYEKFDRSREHFAHLKLKHRVARELKSAFEKEGNGFISENLLQESLDSTGFYYPDGRQFSRYLYCVESS